MNLLLRSALVATTFGLFVGCGLLNKPGGGDGGGGGGSDQAMLDATKDQPTVYTVALPPNPKVGMWWEHTASGTKMKYAITAAKDDKLIVEQEQAMGETTLVNAWLVDPSVNLTAMPNEGEKFASNVSMAWVGIKGDVAHERKVMDVPVYKKTETTGEAADYKEGDESIKLAGKSWDSHWTETKDAKSWMVKDSTFLLKSMYQGKVSMELTAVGGDAKSGLKWDGDKKEEKKMDEKK